MLTLQTRFEAGGDHRPPLHQWMLSNFDEVAALFEGARLNWRHLAGTFAEMGFMNGNGTELKPETVRQTWYRVRKQRARMKQPYHAPVEVLTPSTITPAADPLADIKAEMNKRSGRS